MPSNTAEYSSCGATTRYSRRRVFKLGCSRFCHLLSSGVSVDNRAHAGDLSSDFDTHPYKSFSRKSWKMHHSNSRDLRWCGLGGVIPTCRGQRPKHTDSLVQNGSMPFERLLIRSPVPKQTTDVVALEPCITTQQCPVVAAALATVALAS
jgi:hypothetical protein